MRALIVCAAFVLGFGSGPLHAAESYPSKPVKLVVGYSPGGPGDAVARHLARKLSESLGQPVVVDNRPGAAGSIAAATVAKAAPDGHTLLYANSDFVIYPALHANTNYDPVKDFAPVSGLSKRALVLVVNPALGVKSVRDLIDMAKRQPGALHYGSSGVASFEHLTAAAFQRLAGIDLVHVPYRGSAPAILDLVAGRIQLSFEVTVSIAGHIASGKLRPLMTTGRERFSSLPNVPTAREVGLPEVETTIWSAILAPAGTSAQVISRLNAEVARARNASDTVRSPIFVDAVSFTGRPDELSAHIMSELTRYAKIINAAGIDVRQ